MDSHLVEWIDEQCKDATDCHEASERIRKSTFGIISWALDEICTGLDYHRGWPESSASIVFGPMVEGGEFGYPPPLEFTSVGMQDAWKQIATASKLPLIKARAAHLVWESGAGSFREAVIAVDNYLELASRDDICEVERGDNICYAIDIARRINDRDRQVECMIAALQLIEQALNSPDPAPGAALQMMKVLSKLKEVENARLLDIGERMADLFPDPHLQDAILEVVASLTATPNREAVHRRLVESWIRAAEHSDGLVRASHYTKAAERARAYGLVDLEGRAHLGLEDASSLGDLKTISVTASIPAETFERRIALFVGSDGWESALTRLATYWPVDEDRGRAEKYVHDLMRENPLQFSVARTYLDGEGIPTVTVRSEESHFKAALADHEIRAIGLWAWTVADVLERVFARWNPTEASVAAYLKAPFVTDQAAESLARAIDQYRAGDYESAMMVALPRIEQCIREWAREAGIPITEGDRFGTIMKRSLGALLHGLSADVSADYFRYLLLVLVEPTGMNLRNVALHGLMGRVNQCDAALVIHIALTLSVWAPNE